MGLMPYMPSFYRLFNVWNMDELNPQPLPPGPPPEALQFFFFR